MTKNELPLPRAKLLMDFAMAIDLFAHPLNFPHMSAVFMWAVWIVFCQSNFGIKAFCSPLFDRSTRSPELGQVLG